MSHSTLSLGIVGLPNVGKSTLFNALLKKQAALAANYPFATIEPNVGVVDVPDTRIDRLCEIVKTDFQRGITHEVPEKIVPAFIKFYDIAGLVKGASKGEGLGNAFLSHIRETDAILHLVRAFTDENVIRAGATSPKNDIEIINTELILSDISMVEKRIEQLSKDIKTQKDKNIIQKYQLCLDIKENLYKGMFASHSVVSDVHKELVKDLNLLTIKPIIYVYNVDEGEIMLDISEKFNESIPQGINICAKIEAELCSFDPNEKAEYLRNLGVTSSGLDRIIREGYKTLNLESYFTAGPKEVHVWTYTEGAKAPEAAGKIHTDFERGFIAAEVVAFEDLNKLGSMKRAKDEGRVRLEGKSYTMRDGDVVEFRFNV